MRKSKTAFFCLFIFLARAGFCAQDFALPSPTGKQFIYYTADKVLYDKENGVAELKGNVEIVFDDGKEKQKISADALQLYLDEQLLATKGPTVIESDQGVFTAKDIRFDLKTHRLIMQDITADYSPIKVISAKEIETRGNAYVLHDAQVTCCSLDKPHYTLEVGTANLVPGKRIFATNAVVKVGKIPVFYLPFVYRSLNQNRLYTTYLDFDQSDNTGFGFLTSNVFSRDAFSATVNLDYYTRSGFGYGAQVAYLDPQKFRGSLQAYTIYDKVEDRQRWGVSGGYWWEVYDSSQSLNKKDGALYFSQLETRTVSDADFNDDFFRSNPYVVSPDKLTRASIVRQSSISTFRVSYSSRSELNADDKTYSNAEVILPKADLFFNPFVIKGTGLVNNVSFSLNNTKIEDYDYVQYMSGKWDVSKDFKLHRNFTLTPTAFYHEDIILRDPTNNNEDRFISRYGAQLNLRSDFITGLLDVGYKYMRRTAAGALTSQNINTETGEVDNGEEINTLYVQNYYMPVQDFYFKTGTGYDLRNTEEDWQVKDRLQPLLAEVGFFSPVTGTNIYAQNLYDVAGGNQAFVLNALFKDTSGSSVNFGVTNYSTDRNSFLFTSKFMLAPKNMTWRADMGVDFDWDKDTLWAYSKHIKIYKDFHDVSLMFGVRDRNKNLSFSFRINILCGAKKKTETEKQTRNYFYPWRDENLNRDNF